MCKDYMKFSVGSEMKPKMKEEGGVFETYDNVCLCIIGLENLKDEEIKAFNTSDITVTLTYVDRIIFMVVTIEDVAVLDMPFNMGQYNEFQLKEPIESGYMMPIILVDADTNIIRAIRLAGLPKDMSQKLYELSKEQWENKITDHNERIDRIYSNYTPQDLIKAGLIHNIYEGCQKR